MSNRLPSAQSAKGSNNRRSTKTVRATVAQAVVQYLQVQFSEHDGQTQRLIPAIFGIFGHGNVVGLGQALDDVGSQLPFFQGRNEQSMVHAAAAFAKATRRRSTLACTASIGPGSTNMITGAAGATINRLPVLLLPSDYFVTRRQGTVLQQLEHRSSGDVSVNDCFRVVCQFFDRISRPEQLVTALPEAMRILTNPEETGAVAISLPQDIQAQAYSFPGQLFEPRTWSIPRRRPDERSIAEAAELLVNASRPIVIAGGGVRYSEAEDHLARFAGAFGLPVAETFGGKGSIREASWQLLGGVGLEGTGAAKQIAEKADLVIAIGTRLTDFTTGSQSLFQNPDVSFVSINVCDRDARKLGALGITADAREALQALTEACLARGVRPKADYQAEVTSIRNRWFAELDSALEDNANQAMSQGQLIRTLNEFVQPGDTVVSAAGTAVGDLQKMWEATNGRNCHLEFGYSCMGYELPGALGTRMAQQGGEVYAFLGDGTFLLNPGEIALAFQEGLKITAIISENHGFQSIRRLQMFRVGRPFGNEFRSRVNDRLDGPYLKFDLAKVAEGLGAVAFRARTPREFREALGRARDEKGPCAVVCETEPHRYLPGSGVWWDVAPPEESDRPELREIRAQYERELASLQRQY